MSEYKQFSHEKEQIDALLEDGYRISDVKENLSGAFVEFVLFGDDPQKEKTKQLQILTADARKYFSTILFSQKKHHCDV